MKHRCFALTNSGKELSSVVEATDSKEALNNFEQDIQRFYKIPSSDITYISSVDEWNPWFYVAKNIEDLKKHI